MAVASVASNTATEVLRPESEEEVLHGLLVGRVVEPVLDGLLAEKLVDVQTEAGTDSSHPVDPGQIQVRQLLPELGGLLPDCGEDQGPYRDHHADHGEKGKDCGNRAGHLLLKEPHEWFEEEHDPGREGDREPDDTNRPGHLDQSEAKSDRPHRDPDDQCDALQSLGGHGAGL